MTIKCTDRTKCHKCRVNIECAGTAICDLPGFNTFKLAKKKWCNNTIIECEEIIKLAETRLKEIEKNERKNSKKNKVKKESKKIRQRKKSKVKKH